MGTKLMLEVIAQFYRHACHPQLYNFKMTLPRKSGAVFLSDKRLFCKLHKVQHHGPHWDHMQQVQSQSSHCHYPILPRYDLVLTEL